MIERVAEIVAAYLKRNSVTPDQVPALIQQVYEALTGLGQTPPAAPTAMPRTPAVPIRRSISADKIICLDCGRSGSMLKRHLLTAHGLSVDEYRTRWKLSSDYPMSAPNYTVRRSEIAKTTGLGQRGRGSAKS